MGIASFQSPGATSDTLISSMWQLGFANWSGKLLHSFRSIRLERLELFKIMRSFLRWPLPRQRLHRRYIRTPNENSVLTLEAPEKRESESSGPNFCTGGCNLEGCVRETEISLQTESAAV